MTESSSGLSSVAPELRRLRRLSSRGAAAAMHERGDPSSARALSPPWQFLSRAERAARRGALRDHYFKNMSGNVQQRKRSDRKRRQSRAGRAQKEETRRCKAPDAALLAVRPCRAALDEIKAPELPLLVTPAEDADEAGGSVSGAPPQRVLNQVAFPTHPIAFSPSQSSPLHRHANTSESNATPPCSPRALVRAISSTPPRNKSRPPSPTVSPPRVLTRAERAERRAALRDQCRKGFNEDQVLEEDRPRKKRRLRRMKAPVAPKKDEVHSASDHEASDDISVLPPSSLELPSPPTHTSRAERARRRATLREEYFEALVRQRTPRGREACERRKRHQREAAPPTTVQRDQAICDGSDSDVSFETTDDTSECTSDSDFACSTVQVAAPEQGLSEVRGVNSFHNFPEHICVLIMEYMTQGKIFQAASACKLLQGAARTPHLYSCLDLRGVGRFTTRLGRKTRLQGEAVEASLFKMVEQRRFHLATVMDFSGQYMLDWERILAQAAATCPNLRKIKFGRVEPGEVWSDLARYLPKCFERKIRDLWKARPLTIEAWDRSYCLFDYD